VRSELGIGLDDVVVGSVGHLRPEKAFEVLVEAHSRIARTRPNAHLIIAGEGAERQRLEQEIERLGSRGKVHLLGLRDDVADVLAALDIAVCCSDYEGGPLSVMEYMSAALPIVATDVGGLPELIRNEESGLLVAPRAPAELAECVERLLSDPIRAERLGSRAREIYRDGYSIESWIDRLERLYAALLDAKRLQTPT
jgi:glycosyltransferase involved in cell wall biosynthesis